MHSFPSFRISVCNAILYAVREASCFLLHQCKQARASLVSVVICKSGPLSMASLRVHMYGSLAGIVM